MSGGSVNTVGNSASAVYATGRYSTVSGVSSVVSLDNVSITTNGAAAHGIYSEYEYSGISYAYLKNTSVATVGSNSHAINSYRGNIEMNGARLTADDSRNSYAI